MRVNNLRLIEKDSNCDRLIGSDDGSEVFRRYIKTSTYDGREVNLRRS